MDLSLALAFWAVAIALAVTPGADWAYAIAAGTRARSVAPSILGMLVGYAFVIVVIAVGLGAVVTEFPVALTALTIGGAAYLVWLGASTLHAAPAAVTDSGESVRVGSAGQFLRGMGVSGINPKGLLLLLALLPQFTSRDGWAPAAQMLVLGSMHLINCAVVYTSVALLARRLLRARPTATAWVTRISAIIMVGIGVVILVEQVLALR